MPLTVAQSRREPAQEVRPVIVYPVQCRRCKARRLLPSHLAGRSMNVECHGCRSSIKVRFVEGDPG